MKDAKILCVCGSGTVSSAMVAGKLKEQLADKGYYVTCVEASPPGVESALAAGGFDLIACVSPVYADYDVPKVAATGMLTGLSEDQVIADCLAILDGKA